MADKGSSGIVQIVIAIITVIGSLGVAYITTGKTFESEVNQAQLKIADLQKQSDAAKALATDVQTKLSTQQGEVEQRIAELKNELGAAEKKNAEFQQELASLQQNIQTSQKTVSDTAADAINRINTAKMKALSERAVP